MHSNATLPVRPEELRDKVNQNLNPSPATLPVRPEHAKDRVADITTLSTSPTISAETSAEKGGLGFSNSNNAPLSFARSGRTGRGAQDRFATIMLDPVGNSLPFAHALQTHIEQAVPGTRVILTRTANETVRPLQHANFANRLEVDLFLSLRCYEDASTRPQLAIYTFSYGDYAPSRIQDLAFYTYDQAHLLASGATQKYAHAMEDTFKKYAKQFDLIGSFSLPYKPLIGVTAPAIGIEIGLKNKQSWQSFVAPLCEAVAEIMHARN